MMPRRLERLDAPLADARIALMFNYVQNKEWIGLVAIVSIRAVVRG